MRILMVHCRYRLRGGEDECFEAEHKLLRDAGIEVDTYEDDNTRIPAQSRVRTAIETVWSKASYDAVRERLRTNAYDVVHVHNSFPLISPAVYHAAKAEGCAVVQTLHNYRLSCPGGIYYRNGRVCEDCKGKTVAWPGVLHGCYRNSRAGTAAVAAMLATHKLMGTFHQKVDVYIALNEFMRRKAIEGGLPADRIAIKPNFVSQDRGMGDGRGGFALFAARLTREKGVAELLEAWERLGDRVPLKIMGDGPMTAEVERAAATNPGIEFVGRQPLPEFYRMVSEAHFFIFTSTWYEGFPRVISECYAHGLPIVASGIGPIAEVVIDRKTGLHFRPGDVDDLVTKVRWLLDNPDAHAKMRTHARREFETKYTASANLPQLIAIYERAMGIRAREAQRAA